MKKVFGIKSLRQFVFSYLILLLVFLIMWMTAFYIIRKENVKNSIQLKQTMFGYMVERMEDTMEYMDSLSEQLMMNAAISGVVTNANNNPYVIGRVAREELPSLGGTNDMIQNYMIYSDKNKTVMAPGQAMISYSMYYGNYFSLGDYSGDEFGVFLSEGRLQKRTLPAMPNVYNRKEKESIIYSIPFINQQTGRTMGTIVFFLDAGKLRRMLSETFYTVTDTYYVLDEVGNKILLSDKTDGSIQLPSINLPEEDKGNFVTTIDGIKMQVSYQRSGKLGWVFVAATRNSAYSQETWSNIRYAALIMAILMIVMLFMMWSAFLVNYRPLVSLALRLSDKKAKNSMKNGLWQLDEGVEELAVELDHYKAIQREAFIRRLTEGEVYNIEEVRTNMKKMGLNTERKAFYGVYMQIAETDYKKKDEQEMHSHVLLQKLLQKENDLSFLSMYDDNTWQLIFSSMDENTDKQKLFGVLHHKIKDALQQDVRFCVGRAVHHLEKIHYSFTDARELLLRPDDGYVCLTYDSLMDKDSGYSYKNADRQAFLQALFAGNEAAARKILDRIYYANFVNGHLDSLMRQFLFVTVINTIMEADEKGEYYKSLYRDYPYEDTEYFFKQAEAAVKLLCEERRIREEKKKKDLAEKIMDYIKENAGDCNMGLTLLSEEFGMTEKYISLYIKENAGVNFHKYLEEERMAQADELLKTTSLKMEEIAERVGYVNVNSFRRVYQRVRGISPSEYRKNNG